MSDKNKRPATSVSGRIPRLQSFLDEDRMVLDVKADDLEGAVASLVECLVRNGITSAESAPDLVAKVVARDKVASNAIGLGVACPHAFVDTVDRPLVVFGRLSEPLDLGAPDGRPTDLVFLLVGRKEDAQEHLQMLMHLARLSQDDRFLDGVRRAESPTDVVNATLAAEQRIRTPLSQAPNLSRAGIEYRSPRFAGGLIDDLKRRLPFYKSDFTDGFNGATLAATVFLFFACFTGAVTFGALTAHVTGNEIGTFEMILATCVCGIVYGLFSGQPLVILGGTGPILIFTAVLYQFCQDWNLPFMPTYAWVGLWSAGFTVLLAVTDASVLLRYVTRFTDEIFILLMALIFIEAAVKEMVHDFETHDYATALSGLVLALLTLVIVLQLRAARRGNLLRGWARNFLADFGTIIAILVTTWVAAHMSTSTALEHINVPASFSLRPSDHLVGGLFGLKPLAILGCAVPAMFLTILVFLTQQLTARVCNAPTFNLQKGPGYHLDLLVIGVLLAFCSVFGLPWMCAATVRSLNHIGALATTHVEDVKDHTEEQIDRVIENRVSPVLIHVLVGVALAFLSLLAWVPMAALYGIFLYMGIVSFSGNQFWQRLSLWLQDPARYPPTHYLRQVPTKTVHLFTLVQLVAFVILWTVKVTIGILFPLFLALLIPLRVVLAQVFDPKHLLTLDAEELPDEERDWEVD